MSRHERSGWRDKDISARHRLWGFNCPAVDLDFLVIEYHFAKPVALIEYKHMKHHEGDNVPLLHPTYRALMDLADNYSTTYPDGTVKRTPLPFLLVRYEKDPWWFRMKPINEAAITARNGDNGWSNWTELQFVRGLYNMRDLKVHEQTDLAQLDDVQAWVKEVA